MKTIRFTSTRLQDSGKKGILVPDADGYYEMPVGGLNAFNSAGEYYTLKGAEDLFRESSTLMRRVGNGYLKSELGHPKLIPGMSNDQFLARVLTIEETNVAAHIKEIRLDHNFGANNPKFKNPNLVAVIAKLRPSGPNGPALEASLNNPSENVGFSIRGLTQNVYERGQCYRILTTIVTFDQVTEQGIQSANKWDAPSLESIDASVSERQLMNIVNAKSSIAVESTRQIAAEALRSIQISELPKIPLHSKW